MHTSFISAAFLALATAVYGQTDGFAAMSTPTQDQVLKPGSSFDLIWEAGSSFGNGTVTITLLQGAASTTLQLGDVLKAGVENDVEKFTWVVPKADFATYGFKISLDSDASVFQYSRPFHIEGGETPATGTPTGTVTKTLSTGTAFTASTSTSNVPSSSSAVRTTTALNITSTTIRPTGSSNVTLSSRPSSTRSSVPANTTSNAPAQQSASGAVANLATGGMAVIGGLVLAFFL